MNPQDQNDTTRARQGEAQGRMRYVLAISLGAAIAAMGLAWVLIR
jgi:hypothetical protein